METMYPTHLTTEGAAPERDTGAAVSFVGVLRERAHKNQRLKMLIGLEHAHAFSMSMFGGFEHLRDLAPQFFRH